MKWVWQETKDMWVVMATGWVRGEVPNYLMPNISCKWGASFFPVQLKGARFYQGCPWTCACGWHHVTCMWVASCDMHVAYLVLPVVMLGVLDHSVAQLEEVFHGLVTFVQEISHLEQWLPTVALHGDTQQVEDLVGGGRRVKPRMTFDPTLD